MVEKLLLLRGKFVEVGKTGRRKVIGTIMLVFADLLTYGLADFLFINCIVERSESRVSPRDYYKFYDVIVCATIIACC